MEESSNKIEKEIINATVETNNRENKYTILVPTNPKNISLRVLIRMLILWLY